MNQTIQAQIEPNPPLAWVGDAGQAGWVIGLGPSGLLVQTNTSLALRQSLPEAIEVMLASRASFRFTGSWHARGDAWFLEIAEPTLAKLQELLGQLRKDQHIELCRSQDVESSDRFTGFEQLSLRPETLPLIEQQDLDTSMSLFGRTFALPFLITGMTGGVEKGVEINRRLAVAAANFGIPMGVGSQRVALENPSYEAIFRVKQHAPHLYLIGNLGMAQILDNDALDRCQRAVAMIEADALAIHINLVQELVQVEGDRHFTGFLKQLEAICTRLQVPVIAKEVGCGMTAASARRLADAGVAAIDIGGRGGTSWARIEGLRSLDPLVRELGESFRNWGIPTAYSLAVVREALPDLPIIATGGIRDGQTVAKAVALGARATGIGLPLLRAALTGEEELHQALTLLQRGLELTLRATGSTCLKDLRGKLMLGRPLESTFHAILARIEADQRS